MHQLQSDQIDQIAAALCKAQASLRGAVKDSDNPFFKSKYADLESVWEACRESLAKNDLSVVQTTTCLPEIGTCLVTTLAHSSGQWIRGFYPLRPVKDDPQGVGSAMTYARRYALAAIVGVIQVDDDAEAAMGRGEAKAAQVQEQIAPQLRPQFGSQQRQCAFCGSVDVMPSQYKKGSLYCRGCKKTAAA
jgi:hypothetical protein